MSQRHNISFARLVLLAAVAALLWYGFDSLHVRKGIFAVANTQGVPWWMVLCYFAGFVGAGLFFRGLDRRTPMRNTVTRARLLVEVIAFLAVLAAHYAFYADEVTYTLLAAGYVALRMVKDRQPGDVAAMLFVVLLDLAVELTLTHNGRFAYSHTQWLPVPLWLSPMWAGLALSVRRFYAVAMGVGTTLPDPTASGPRDPPGPSEVDLHACSASSPNHT